MIVVPFAPEHLAQIDLDAEQRKMVSLATTLEQWSGKAITVCEGDEPIAAFGISICDRVGTAWACIGPAMKERPVALHRFVKRNIPVVMAHFELIAIEAHADDAVAHRWLTKLGFVDAKLCMRLT